MSFVYAGRYNEFSPLLALATAPMMFSSAVMGSEVAVQVMQAPSEVFLAYSVSRALAVLTGIAFTHIWGLTGGLVGLLISAFAFWAMITYRYHKRLRAAHPDSQKSARVPRDDERVVWLMPTIAGAYYWQPVFKAEAGPQGGEALPAVAPQSVIVTTSWDDGDPLDLEIARMLAERRLAGTFYIPIRGHHRYGRTDRAGMLSLDYLENSLSSGDFRRTWSHLIWLPRARHWVELAMHLFDLVVNSGGVWHLFGHSWEINDFNLWEELPVVLDYVSNRPGVLYLPNSGVVRLGSVHSSRREARCSADS
jgi:hypothetical protein